MPENICKYNLASHVQQPSKGTKHVLWPSLWVSRAPTGLQSPRSAWLPRLPNAARDREVFNTLRGQNVRSESTETNGFQSCAHSFRPLTSIQLAGYSDKTLTYKDQLATLSLLGPQQEVGAPLPTF